MTVSNPQQLDLSGAYQNILRALDAKRQAINDTPLTPLANVANAVGKATGAYVGTKIEGAHEKDLLTFKSSLEKELQANQAKATTDAQGYKDYTQEDVNTYFKSHGITDEKHIPQLGNFRAKPQEFQDAVDKSAARVEVERLASTLEKTDPKRAAALRIVSNGSLPEGTAKQVKEIILPEDDIKKNAPKPIMKGFDAFGRQVATYDDGTTKYGAGQAIKEVPEGELVTSKDGLRGTAALGEQKIFNQGLSLASKQTKPIVDSLDKIKNTEKIVNENNPNTLINIKAEDLQTSGITGGRLNQKYITQEGFNPGIVQKGQQLLTSWQGNQALSNDNKKAILAYLKVKKAEAQDTLSARLSDVVATTHSSMPDPTRIDPAFIAAEFKKPISSYLPKEAGSTDGGLLKVAITKYLTARNLPADNAHIKAVADNLNSERTSNLLAQYGH